MTTLHCCFLIRNDTIAGKKKWGENRSIHQNILRKIFSTKLSWPTLSDDCLTVFASGGVKGLTARVYMGTNPRYKFLLLLSSEKGLNLDRWIRKYLFVLLNYYICHIHRWFLCRSLVYSSLVIPNE